MAIDTAGGRVERWLGSKVHDEVTSDDVLLLCFPHAGGAASAYREWGRLTASGPQGVTCLGVRLPGREQRIGEPRPADISGLAAHAAMELEPLLTHPYALFGHSMGALLALEFAKWARINNLPEPRRLYVSGCAPPASRRLLDRHRAEDAELVSWLRSLGGMPDEVLEDGELLALMLPLVRSDLTMLANYQPGPGTLSCPVTILAGAEDSGMQADSLPAWSRETSGPTEYVALDGDHFYLHVPANRDQLHERFVRDLAGVPVLPTASPVKGGNGRDVPGAARSQTTDAEIFGIGFGPANLALAIALDEAGLGSRSHFVERQSKFAWHEAMMIEGARLQVSFLKDLVTLRNPQSPLSFLSYLHERGRLVDFINSKTIFPLRIEFNEYLAWAATRVGSAVHYSSDALSVEPVFDADGAGIGALDVSVGVGERRRTFRTSNLVFGMGGVPSLPPGVTTGDRVWHSSQLLHRVGVLDGHARQLVVVGSGQSAAEVAAYLHDRFANAEVHAVMSRFGYSRSDDSAFTNRIFDPAGMQEFFDAPQTVKDSLLAHHSNVNNSVVDGELIAELFDRQYLELVTGRRRLHLANVSTVGVLASGPTDVELEITSLSTGQVTRLVADAVVYATGYRPADPLQMLGDLSRRCLVDARGLPQVTRDFRLVTDDNIRCRIYLQGPTEHTHGISSTLLSNAAIRAGEIARSIVLSSQRPAYAPALGTGQA